MNYKKSHSSASSSEELGLLVTGGFSEYGALDSTEVFSSKDSIWKEGPTLPVKMSDHCQVTSKVGAIVAGEAGH